jgi:lysophospholipase L1-like esterase
MSGLRRGLRDVLFVTAAGVALLLALEGGIRLAGIDARDLPVVPPRTAGVFRIVALGGSTVLGVPDGTQGFMAQLERQLRRAAPGRPLEVLNLARSGVGSRTVLATLDRVLAEPPDLLIVLMGHNEFLEPRPGWLQRLRDASRLAAWLGRGVESDAAAPEHFPEQLRPVAPEGPEARLRREAFLRNLDALVDRSRAAGVALVLCTAPSNLAEWPPAHRRVRGALDEATVSRIQELLAAGQPGRALESVRRERESRGDEAMLAFLEGAALHGLDRDEEAREPFVHARAIDPIPRRAYDAFNRAVREKATLPGVHVVDVVRRFEEHAHAGLVGFELICDNCHPTPLGNAIIAREIALALRDQGLFLSRDARIPELAGFVARLPSLHGSARAQLRSRLRWLLSNAIYSMKTPFFNFEASRMYLEQARSLAPGDWRVHANLATLSLLAGDLAQGRRSLARAAALKGSALDPRDRDVTPYLGEALARSGLLPESDAGGP